MGEVQRDLHVLISIAKLDASLNAARTELRLLPAQVEKVRRSLKGIGDHEAEARTHIEEMAKERRALEQELDDNAEKVKKYRVQLMEVKTNKEYTAMLHEIEHIEKDTEAKEERLLVLMDELDQETEQNEVFLGESRQKKAVLGEEQGKLEDRIKSLAAETEQLEAEKPKLLAELDPRLKRRYDRILAKLHDFAVTHVADGTCQGCFTRIPPQTVVEVRRNDKLITCEACGRILVYYIT
jgi:predicted  nucleic acid-binding Zn-ribbon protein